jgi:hypothetical protein
MHDDTNTQLNPLTGQADAPTQLPGQRFHAPTQMFRLSQPPAAPAQVDDPVTMVFDPATLDGLRTDTPSNPFMAPGYPYAAANAPFVAPVAPPISSTPTTPKRDHRTLIQRVAVIGGAAVAAALLVYFGRGLVAQPVETNAPVEVAAPTTTDQQDEAAAPIELAPTLEVATSAAPPLAPVGALPPLVDEHTGQVAVSSGAASPTEQLVAALAPSTASSTESSSTGSGSEPVGASADQDVAPAAVAETTTSEQTETATNSTTDQVATTSSAATDQTAQSTAATTDQVATDSTTTTTDQVAAADTATTSAGSTADTATSTAGDQATTAGQGAADQTTAAGGQVAASGSGGSSGGTPVQVTVPPVAAQQVEQYTDGKHYGSRGAEAANQALSQLPQAATSGIQQGKALFGHR